jgi:5-methylcytosine-specific restriction endonuclease McrA
MREIQSNARSQDYLLNPIRSIHNLCRDQLSAAQRSDLAQWFDNNNDIEGLCTGKPGVSPVTYTKVALINPQLARELKEFCTNLWSEVRRRTPVTNLIGTLGEHFKEFRKTNRIGICPFCGLTRIEGVFSSIQEDYDHYLPKGSYAFNAVALKNLIPICDKCNKKFKLQQDPLHRKDGSRRKAFYVYASASVEISFSITLTAVNDARIDPARLCPENIQLEITAPGQEEELEGWKEVFKIEERYKDLCCEGTGGSYWLEQVLDEMRFKDKTPSDALAAIQRAASVSRWADANFLKVPFLEGCMAAGFIR